MSVASFSKARASLQCCCYSAPFPALRALSVAEVATWRSRTPRRTSMTCGSLQTAGPRSMHEWARRDAPVTADSNRCECNPVCRRPQSRRLLLPTAPRRAYTPGARTPISFGGNRNFSPEHRPRPFTTRPAQRRRPRMTATSLAPTSAATTASTAHTNPPTISPRSLTAILAPPSPTQSLPHSSVSRMPNRQVSGGVPPHGLPKGAVIFSLIPFPGHRNKKKKQIRIKIAVPTRASFPPSPPLHPPPASKRRERGARDTRNGNSEPSHGDSRRAAAAEGGGRGRLRRDARARGVDQEGEGNLPAVHSSNCRLARFVLLRFGLVCSVTLRLSGIRGCRSGILGVTRVEGAEL